jgi:bacterioferritin-associated ferredoxin
MWICLCKAVNTGTIRAAIDEGAKSLSAIADACAAGTVCGKCKRTIYVLLGERVAPPPAGRTAMSAPYRMTIIHSVPDFERWRSVLSDDPGLGRPGLLHRSVYRSLDDPNEVMVEVEFETAEAARALLPSLDLREVLDRAGLEVYPPVFIGEELRELRYDRQPE